MFLFALLLECARCLSVWQGDGYTGHLRVTRPIKKYASILDEIRPPQCLNESLDTMFGEHYYPVHSKSVRLNGRECRFKDFAFPKTRSLGSGGYGKVVVGIHKPTNQTFALKSIIEMNPEWHKWIRAEECIQYGLDFPLITKHYCTMVDEWFAWLVLELVKGETLQRILQTNSRKIDPQRIIAQLILTLEYLKLNNIVVGDLTAANVMIEEDGSMKLIDFGFARRLDNNSSLSPTWNDGRVLPDFSSNPYLDWYAVGMIIYEIMVALRPNVICEEQEEGKETPPNPNMPKGARVREKNWPNCAWIKPQKLKLQRCKDFLDSVACNLIGSFIGFKNANDWNQTWGLTSETLPLIKSHPWFGEQDWTSLEIELRPYMKVDPYNA